MDIPDETIRSYWEKLKICQYPNIERMFEMDVRKIFDKENRLKFLTWAMTKLIPAYEYRLQSAKNHDKLESTIANMIYSNGFCKNSEKNDFITGKLKIQQDISIMNKLFMSLTVGYKNIDKENMESDLKRLKDVLKKPTKELIENVLLCNENIFPDEGKFKPMNEKERSDKIESYKKILNTLDVDIETMEKEKESLISEMNEMKELKNINIEEIEESNKKFIEAFEVFENNFPEYQANFPEQINKSTDSDIGLKFEQINKNINFALKVLNSYRYLNELDLNINEENNESLNEERVNLREMIDNNYITSEELLEHIDLNNKTLNSYNQILL